MTDTLAPAPRPARDRRNLLLVLGVLLAATVLLRLPPLINARDVSSDAAVVGLQAMHMLRGEWSWLLWGAGYQSSLDSAITALSFAIFGASPLVLALVPLAGHVIAMYLALVVLKKRVGLGPATFCVLTLAAMSCAISGITVAPPRQWCITLIFVAIWLLDGAADSVKWSLVRFALGMLAAALAVFVDLFALVLMPGVALLALMCATDGTSERRTWLKRTAACAAGGAAGAIAVVAIRLIVHAPTERALNVGFYHFRYRLALLWNECGPFSLGYKLYRDSDNPFARTLWAAPLPWNLLQALAGWSLVAGIASGAVLFANRKISWQARRLGLFGAVVAATTLAGFMASTKPLDTWAARYLGPIFLMAPFALAPLAARLGTRRFGLAIAPYLIVASIGLWSSYGFYVQGPWPRNFAATKFEQEEQRVCDFLRSRGIRYAASDYWFAYRISFVFREDPVIAPIDRYFDRYSPYAEKFHAQKVKAWVFHPNWSRTPMDRCLAFLQQQGIPFSRQQVGDFTVVLFPAERPAALAPAAPAAAVSQAHDAMLKRLDLLQ